MVGRRARFFRAAVFGAGALFVGLPSCGGGDDAGPPILIDDLAKEMADALCNNIGPCCAQQGYPNDQAQCHATAESGLTTSIARYKIDGVNYDANAARACVNTYAETARTCGDPSAIQGPCGGVFAGSKMPGEACTTSLQCASGGQCQPPTSGGASQCTAPPSRPTSSPRGKKGDVCGGTCTSSAAGDVVSCGGGGGAPTAAANCYTNDGLYCDVSFVCSGVPVLGQACPSGAPCSSDAFCDNGTCAAKRTSGPCVNSNACADTAYCDFGTQTCLPRKALGEPCVTSVECPTDDRCTNGICRPRTIASSSTCSGTP